ncbi:MAG: hypothetical protein HY739_14640 [Desulfobacterales bacterium]|nr:hypothetical protein [Desulfobacterales bacterium]
MLSFVYLTEARADDIEFQTGMTQSYFKDFSKELGAVLSYKALSPAEPLGTLGFDVGLEISATDIDEGADYWKKATKNADMPGLIPLPKIYIRKGLPLNIDVGAIYSKVPNSNISLLGAEVKYAILKGSVATPAVAIRGSYTQLLGVDQLDFKTYGADISISKGFLNMTPFGGIGAVWTSSEPKSLPAGISLNKENNTQIKYFGGVRFTLLMLNMTAGVEYMGVPTYSLRAGIIF